MIGIYFSLVPENDLNSGDLRDFLVVGDSCVVFLLCGLDEAGNAWYLGKTRPLKHIDVIFSILAYTNQGRKVELFPFFVGDTSHPEAR